MATIKGAFIHKAGAYRSGLEKDIQIQLNSTGIKAEYEPGRIEYKTKPSHYTPDFVLPNGIVIETKGYFLPQDRTKHLLIKAQYPDIDLRFVFANPKAKLNKRSNTTYAEWCKKNGFLYAIKRIPDEWLYDSAEPKRINAIKEVLKVKHA